MGEDRSLDCYLVSSLHALSVPVVLWRSRALALAPFRPPALDSSRHPSALRIPTRPLMRRLRYKQPAGHERSVR
eukprot:6176259-Pleurochrysis_carterae.AAC.2